MNEFKLVRNDYGFVIERHRYGEQQELSVKDVVRLLNYYKRYHDRVEEKKVEASIKRYSQK